MTRDEWPNYICCVLTVREELVRENRPLVQQLVNYVQAAGTWLDLAPANRTKAVQIAAGPKFFNQDPNVLQFVMDNPSDGSHVQNLPTSQPLLDRFHSVLSSIVV